ncbi:MAG: hypothetical protein LBI82_04845, partial [Dysgonamonadaceae bacterium]|nr:hypothetical protein [Dysgonamonadaceae bacterium]
MKLRTIEYRCVMYAFLSLFLLMASSSLFAQEGKTYYWVGKSEMSKDWTEIDNWSDSPDGPGGLAGNIEDAPTSENTVIFDELSHSDTIIISDKVRCNDLEVLNVGGSGEAPTFQFDNSEARIEISGSLLFHKTVYLLFPKNNLDCQFLHFVNADKDKIGKIKTSGTVMGKKIYYSLYGYQMDNSGSGTAPLQGTMVFNAGNEDVKWELVDALTTPRLLVKKGILDLKTFALTTMIVEATGGQMVFPNNKNITCALNWKYNTEGEALKSPVATNSKIRIHGGHFNGRKEDTYHDVEFYGSSSAHLIDKGKFNTITFKAGKAYQIGVHEEGALITKNLIIESGSEFRFAYITIENEFRAKPAVDGGQVWLRAFDNSPYSVREARIIMGSNNVNVERAVINDLNIEGSMSYEAKNSYNWGNNSGWTYTNPAAGRSLYWIGGNGKWNNPANWTSNSNGTPD